jgi:carbonic anhydrase
VDNWLRPIRDLALLYREPLLQLPDDARRRDRLCELNVLFQALRVCRTTIVRQAWERSKALTVHAWVYALTDGLLRDLGFCASDLAGAEADFGRVAGIGTLGAGSVE